MGEEPRVTEIGLGGAARGKEVGIGGAENGARVPAMASQKWRQKLPYKHCR
jgi:hypothetical protein